MDRTVEPFRRDIGEPSGRLELDRGPGQVAYRGADDDLNVGLCRDGELNKLLTTVISYN